MSQFITDTRASAILARFLASQQQKGIVILPVNICEVVPNVLKCLGYHPHFIDINPDYYTIDERIVKSAIKKNVHRVVGVLFSYTYGADVNAGAFFAEIKRQFPDIWIIDDHCLRWPSLTVSPHADLTLFSTGHAKLVNLGYGGIGIVKRSIPFDVFNRQQIDTINNRLKSTLVYIDSNAINNEIYFNEINKKTEFFLQHHKEINTIYIQNLPESIQLSPAIFQWRFNILVNNKHTLLNAIFKNKLYASGHYKPLGEGGKNFPIATKLHGNVINLFNDFNYTPVQALETCYLINKFL